jgi:hypothetical protein
MELKAGRVVEFGRDLVRIHSMELKGIAALAHIVKVPQAENPFNGIERKE